MSRYTANDWKIENGLISRRGGVVNGLIVERVRDVGVVFPPGL